MWESLKRNFVRGFGLSFGGALGWRLGNFAAGLVSKGWKLLALSLFSWWLSVWAPAAGHEYMDRHNAAEQARKAAQVQQHQQKKVPVRQAAGQ